MSLNIYSTIYFDKNRQWSCFSYLPSYVIYANLKLSGSVRNICISGMHVNHWPWSGTVIFTQNITWCWIYSTTLTLLKCSIHISKCRTLVIWKYASVYIRCLDIVTIVYLYIYHFVYITVIVLYFPFTFCTNNMALYIMVLYAIVYYGTTWYMQSFIYFFLYFIFIFILQCPIMPYK